MGNVDAIKKDDENEKDKNVDVDMMQNDKTEIVEADKVEAEILNDDKAKMDESDNKETNDNEKNEETVFDRIDSIVFCCYDIGNWHLYKQRTPKIFTSSNKDHSYLWNDKLKTKKKAKPKQKTQANSETNQN